MIVDMITAEEARSKVFIDIQRNDMKKVKEKIMSAINANKYGTIIMGTDDHIVNMDLVILELKQLGYKIRPCPYPEEAKYKIIFVQWEEAPPEDLKYPTLCCNWEEI